MNVITSYPVVVNNKEVSHPYYLSADGYSNAFGDGLKGLVGSGKVKGFLGNLLNKGGNTQAVAPPPPPPAPKGMSKGLKIGLIVGGVVVVLGIVGFVIYKTRKK